MDKNDLVDLDCIKKILVSAILNQSIVNSVLLSEKGNNSKIDSVEIPIKPTDLSSFLSLHLDADINKVLQNMFWSFNNCKDDFINLFYIDEILGGSPILLNIYYVYHTTTNITILDNNILVLEESITVKLKLEKFDKSAVIKYDVLKIPKNSYKVRKDNYGNLLVNSRLGTLKFKDMGTASEFILKDRKIIRKTPLQPSF